ncbi:DUF4868 domain-containing protein [Staphylococcus pseudintermedius]|nr:DUF4868 domain-containing protein [Staphylococcus pseudintermedius]
MIQDIINNDFNVYLYLIFDNHISENSNYLNLPITDELTLDLKEICITYVNKIIDQQNYIDTYNIVGVDDNKIEKYDLETNFMNLPLFNNIFTNENRLNNIPPNDIKKYNYFVIEVNCDDERYYFVRKPIKPSSIKKGMILSNERGRYKLIKENDLIIFDDKIDFIYTNEEVYIFKRAVFEKCFDFETIYDFLANNILSDQLLKDGIENYEELLIDIFENKTLKKRVAGLHNSTKTTLFLKQINITQEINDKYQLNLNIANGKLIYEDKSEATHYVAFMQDAFYETYLGKEKGTDTRRG